MESIDLMNCFYLDRLPEKGNIKSNISHKVAEHAQVCPKLHMSPETL